VREVELIGFRMQQIARRPGEQALLAEQFAQLRDVHLDRLLRRRSRLFLPERVDQPIT
jgi:hypothetical protein